MARTGDRNGAPSGASTRVVAEVHADAGPANSAAETTLASLTLPGGLVKAGDLLRFVAGGDTMNNTGASVTQLPRFKIGATTVLTGNGPSQATGANRRKWWANIDITIVSTASQRVAGSMATGSSLSASWGGSASTAGVNWPGGYGEATEDLAADKAFALTMQLGTADVNADFILKFASLIRIPR